MTGDFLIFLVLQKVTKSVQNTKKYKKGLNVPKIA
jgi:hypothetical protein